MAAYSRILLKLSGEVMAGQGGFGIDPDRVQALAAEVAEVASTGLQIGLVVGGGVVINWKCLSGKEDSGC